MIATTLEVEPGWRIARLVRAEADQEALHPFVGCEGAVRSRDYDEFLVEFTTPLRISFWIPRKQLDIWEPSCRASSS